MWICATAAKSRLCLDGVFNHTGVHFGPFQDVLENQEKSRYVKWFHINHYPVEPSHHNYECVGAYKWMPKLDTSNPEVREFILKVMFYWIDQLIKSMVGDWMLQMR